MSKIEEALRKARSVGSLRTKSPGTALQAMAPSARSAQEPVEERQSGNGAEDALVAANRQLARMGDSWFLTEIQRAENRIIFPEMKDERVAHAFRDLRTKIIERAGGRNCTVLVCGVSEHCGASFVALNLAVAFSFDESRTALLVDCDIRRPAYEHLVKGGEQYGITDYFERDDVKIEQIIHAIGIRKLRLMPAGNQRKGAVEYFTSRKIRGLLKGAQKRYPDRFLIINAPPVVQSADTRILANLADLILLVVAYGKATEAQVVAAAQAVKADKLLGVVFNDEPILPAVNWRQAIKDEVRRFLRMLVPKKLAARQK